MLDKQILQNLGLKAQDNSYFALFKYRNNNGKNHWSLICSCIDWLTVSFDGINGILDDISELDINSQCMKLYSYISSVDIMWESVKQLHRVIVGNDTPFSGDKYIFSNNICKDDNLFFEHIRAIFGAHPVNLNDDKERRFASWPTSGVYTEYDYACVLYTSNPDKEDLIVGIKLNELFEYAESRYNYIDKLIKLIEEEYQKFVHEMIEKPIKRDIDIMEQLLILKEESKNRIDNEYYNQIINELIMCFQVEEIIEKFKPQVFHYRERLLEVMHEVLTNLECMNLSELVTDSIINPDCDRSVRYAYSKLSCYIHAGTNYRMIDYSLKVLNNYFKGIITLDSNMSKNELFLYCNVGFYMMSHK